MKAINTALAILILVLTGCASHGAPAAEVQAASTHVESASEVGETNEMEDSMRLLIGETEVPVTWEENASVEALKELFEQVGSIGKSIVRDDKQTKTNYGDIVLYSGDQIVIFYGSNSWSYTRLGHIDLTQQEMQNLLGGGDVSITLQ